MYFISMTAFMRMDETLNVRWVPKRIQNMPNFFSSTFSSILYTFYATPTNRAMRTIACVTVSFYRYEYVFVKRSQFALYIILFVVSVDNVPTILFCDKKRKLYRRKNRWNDADEKLVQCRLIETNQASCFFLLLLTWRTYVYVSWYACRNVNISERKMSRKCLEMT